MFRFLSLGQSAAGTAGCTCTPYTVTSVKLRCCCPKIRSISNNRSSMSLIDHTRIPLPPVSPNNHQKTPSAVRQLLPVNLYQPDRRKNDSQTAQIMTPRKPHFQTSGIFLLRHHSLLVACYYWRYESGDDI